MACPTDPGTVSRLWERSTERPFSGDYRVHDEQGIYHCICCHAPLFENEHARTPAAGGQASTARWGNLLSRSVPATLPACSVRKWCVRPLRCSLGACLPDGPPETTGLRCASTPWRWPLPRRITLHHLPGATHLL
ncbi:peptide-methionine (R)-S-oxide reductase [Billgrantia gudaonensis]|uniref:peptide-methionine (R)-S-oxide reductase n=1 Tax=Billgrantia gudaonensis TaxID=376427 RepID=A0A432JJZ0_9GAMM|nr:peptide-methionine (R)-S-oxide reductase [Halomonas gudaonensis]